MVLRCQLVWLASSPRMCSTAPSSRASLKISTAVPILPYQAWECWKAIGSHPATHVQHRLQLPHLGAELVDQAALQLALHVQQLPPPILRQEKINHGLAHGSSLHGGSTAANSSALACMHTTASSTQAQAVHGLLVVAQQLACTRSRTNSGSQRSTLSVTGSRDTT